MREQRLHFSTALFPVKYPPSPLIEKFEWTTKAVWTLWRRQKTWSFPGSKPRFIVESLYWLKCYVTIDTSYLLNSQELKSDDVIYWQLVDPSRTCRTYFTCCVDLWPSRLYGYGWPTVAYFHAKFREIWLASVQVVGRDTNTTCIVEIVLVSILVWSKESEPNGS